MKTQSAPIYLPDGYMAVIILRKTVVIDGEWELAQ